MAHACMHAHSVFIPNSPRPPKTHSIVIVKRSERFSPTLVMCCCDGMEKNKAYIYLESEVIFELSTPYQIILAMGRSETEKPIESTTRERKGGRKSDRTEHSSNTKMNNKIKSFHLHTTYANCKYSQCSIYTEHTYTQI